MYTSQLHSLTDVIISRRAPGRSLLRPPLGILLALPLGNDSSIYPLPSDRYPLTQAFSPRPSSCRLGPIPFHMAIPRYFPARPVGSYPEIFLKCQKNSP
jgi:hypothetical protein